MRTKHADRFTGTVMRGDAAVAEVESDALAAVTDKAPLYLRHHDDFSGWIESRGADLSRSHMRVILRRLGLPPTDVRAMVMSVYGASVTDTFWIRPAGASLTFADTRFSGDLYAKAALRGDPDLYALPRQASPELTNIGSFHKGWQLRDGRWQLYKAGTPAQHFAELFASKLAGRLGLDAVAYAMRDGYSVCENFVPAGWDLEPAAAVMGDDVDYAANAKVMAAYGVEVLRAYMDLIFMDAIVRNSDRHTFNYGFLTHADGRMRFAPNFDNNLALFHDGIPAITDRDDPLVNDFIAVRRAVPYAAPPLGERMLKEVYAETQAICPTDTPLALLVDFCMNAYRKITD